MLIFLLVSTLVSHCVLAHPLPESLPQPQQGDLPSHIVIVTPQAQVHLDSGLRYDAPGTFIHHLSPLARFVGAQEDTIVYVPASASGGRVAPVGAVPVESYQAAHQPRQDYNINDLFNSTGGFLQSVSNNSLFPQEGYKPPGTQSPGYQPPQFPGFHIPAFQVPGYQPPSVQPPSYQPPASQSPSYQPPASQSPSYQPPASQSPSYQPPASQSPSYQPPASQSPSYQPPASQPPSNQQQSPSYQPPALQSPSYQPPAFSPPSYKPPALQGPSYQPPALQFPALTPPSYQPPTLQGPSYQPPALQGPSYQPPAVQVPSYTQSALQLQPQQNPLEQTPLLLSSNEPRQFYAVAPSAVPQIVEFVHTPMYVGPVSTVRARSVPETLQPSLAAPLPLQIKKSDGIPLTETKLEHPEALPLTQPDFGRFLEASNALKEDINKDLLPLDTPKAEQTPILKANEQPEQQLAPSNNIADAQPILASLDSGLAPKLALNEKADKELIDPIARPLDAITKAA